jgi:hypothetical protein
MRIVQSLTLLAALAVSAVAMADPIAFSSTGLGAVGSVDTHWTITTEPAGTAPSSTSAIVSDGIPGAWVTPPGSTHWDGPTAEGTTSEPAGTYIYTTTFTLTAAQAASASLVGGWASDNESSILLNGNNTGFFNTYASSYPSLTSFDITSGFVTGVNTLSFVITNGNVDTGGTDGAGPTGLLVVDTAPVPSVPEPSSIALLGTGLLSVAGFARRKFRS